MSMTNLSFSKFTVNLCIFMSVDFNVLPKGMDICAWKATLSKMFWFPLSKESTLIRKN